MNPPANPNAEQARADWQAYAQQAGWISAPSVAADTPPIPAHALALYPWLAKHASTARIERVYDAQHDCWRECVTVTV